jgi:hypothetical protein
MMSRIRKLMMLALLLFAVSCEEDLENPFNSPTSFDFFDISTKSATLSWLSSEDASYEIQLGTMGFALGEGSIKRSSENSIELGDLTAGTSYDIYVRAICNGQNMSDWSEVQTFTTLPNCAEITSSTVSNITQTAAFITWQFSGDIPIGWIIEYAEEGFTVGSGVIAETSIDNIPLMNLMTGITYEYYLNSKCVGDNLGERAGPFTFTTQ